MKITVSAKLPNFHFIVRELLMGVAVGNMIEPFVNKEFHTISLAVLKLITCVPKIADFFPSRLGYWQVFGACQYFPSPSSNRHLLHLFLSDLQQTSPCPYPWCLISCVLILALHPLKYTDSLHPRLLSHLLLVMLENEHKAAILQCK